MAIFSGEKLIRIPSPQLRWISETQPLVLASSLPVNGLSYQALHIQEIFVNISYGSI